MINPTESLARIIKLYPDLAVDLADILIWIAEEQPALKENNPFVDMVDACYLTTQHCHDSRDQYARDRLAA